MNNIRQLLAAGTLGVFAVCAASTAAAKGSANTEVSTAHAHALMAQSATMLPMAHTHLQHVINCLVGPKGEGFDASAGDPCKGQGNGALNDVAKDSPVHGALESALKTANAGLKSDNLTAVKNDASKVATTLQGATAVAPESTTTPASSP